MLPAKKNSGEPANQISYFYPSVLTPNSSRMAGLQVFLYHLLPEERKSYLKEMELNSGSLPLVGAALTTQPWVLGQHGLNKQSNLSKLHVPNRSQDKRTLLLPLLFCNASNFRHSFFFLFSIEKRIRLFFLDKLHLKRCLH